MRVLFAHCPDSLVARLPRQKKTNYHLQEGYGSPISSRFRRLSTQAFLFQFSFDIFGKAKIEQSSRGQRRGHAHRYANLVLENVLDLIPSADGKPGTPGGKARV